MQKRHKVLRPCCNSIDAPIHDIHQNHNPGNSDLYLNLVVVAVVVVVVDGVVLRDVYVVVGSSLWFAVVRNVQGTTVRHGNCYHFHRIRRNKIAGNVPLLCRSTSAFHNFVLRPIQRVWHTDL